MDAFLPKGNLYKKGPGYNLKKFTLLLFRLWLFLIQKRGQMCDF